MTSRVPILVTILGATGTGKSKLAIELAQKYIGEIISADSMQVYNGLDVITAKVTKEEQAMAPHHMLDIVDPLSTFTVVDFRNRALPIIEKLLSENKMPIIVGGTNYYIESLLWQVLVDDPKDIGADGSCSLVFDRDGGYVSIDGFESAESVQGESDKKYVNQSKNRDHDVDSVNKKIDSANGAGIDVEDDGDDWDSRTKDEQGPPSKKIKFDDSITNEELHGKLKKIDPDMADRLHPNNRRKIIRSLQVFEQLGTKHSVILQEQRLAGGSGLGGPLRFDNSVIFWIKADQKVLDERLDKRVDSMLESGLVQELLNFHDAYNQERIKAKALPDYTKGIFQTIGFKEFHEYLILSKEDRESDKGKKLLEEGIEDLKLRTRRYARKQQRWVTNRFIKRGDRQTPPIYLLDSTDVGKWEENVFAPAVSIIDDKISGKTPSREPLNSNRIEKAVHSDMSTAESHYCKTCRRVLIGDYQWKAHMEGRKHQRMVNKGLLKSSK
nr:isopentenyl transferase [Euura sp. 'Pontania]